MFCQQHFTRHFISTQTGRYTPEIIRLPHTPVTMKFIPYSFYTPLVLFKLFKAEVILYGALFSVSLFFDFIGTSAKAKTRRKLFQVKFHTFFCISSPSRHENTADRQPHLKLLVCGIKSLFQHALTNQKDTTSIVPRIADIIGIQQLFTKELHCKRQSQHRRCPLSTLL